MRSSAFFFTVYLIVQAPTTTPASAQASPQPAPAPLLVAQATTSAAARTLGQKIGVAGAVRGDVRVIAHGSSTGGTGVLTRSGDAIRLGDKVQSGPDAGLQILLLDETVFSIGPDAEMTVDEFVFDPTTDTGSVAASIGKGAFRFITGRVATKDPQRMSVRLPQATIGIRGTIVAGTVSPTASEVVLLGPGPENNAREKIGAITVSNAAGSVAISRTGFATSVIGQAAPTPPVLLPPDRVRGITQQSNASTGPRPAAPATQQGTQQGQAGVGQTGDGQSRQVAPPSSGPQGQAPGGPQPIGLQAGGPDAGMQLAGAQTSVQQLGGILAPPPLLQQLATEAAQQVQGQLNAITTYEQLLSLNQPAGAAGPATFNLGAVSGAGGGTFNFAATVNFATRTTTLNVGGNYMLGSTPYSGPIYNETFNYNGLAGPTAKTLVSTNPALSANFNGGFLATGHVATIKYALTNNTATGRIADVTNVALTVTDGVNKIEGKGAQPRP